jgi:hypothetical protein
MARDEFPKTIVEVLAKRVANRCSNPSCRALTSGPHTEDAKAVIVGVGAHITAASPSGPRFDKLLSPERRRDASNGIWLCQICGKLIDADPSQYPVEVLREWKRGAEDEARGEIENRDVSDLGPNSAENANQSPMADDLEYTHLQILGLFEEAYMFLENAHDGTGIFHVLPGNGTGKTVAAKVRSLVDRIIEVGHSFLHHQVLFVAAAGDVIAVGGLTAPSMHTWVFDFVRQSILGNAVPDGAFGVAHQEWRKSLKPMRYRSVIGRGTSGPGGFFMMWPDPMQIALNWERVRQNLLELPRISSEVWQVIVSKLDIEFAIACVQMQSTVRSQQ